MLAVSPRFGNAGCVPLVDLRHCVTRKGGDTPLGSIT